MRFILLLLERIQKIPRAEEVNRTRMPSQFVNIKLTNNRSIMIMKLSFMYEILVMFFEKNFDIIIPRKKAMIPEISIVINIIIKSDRVIVFNISRIEAAVPVLVF